ncbi:MAG: hypothetical protein JNK05_25585 [Myxococcales bacterium]|nr:hypothetical protein [Myxococcales bacterium]
MAYPALTWPSWNHCDVRDGWLECATHDEWSRVAPVSHELRAVLGSNALRCVLLRDGALHCRAIEPAVASALDVAHAPLRHAPWASALAQARAEPPIATDVVDASADANRVSWLLRDGSWWTASAIAARSENSARPGVTIARVADEAGFFVGLASTIDESCAWTTVGDVYCSRRSQDAPRWVLRGAIEVASGPLHTCALLRNDLVKCWGDPGFGRLGRSTPSDWRADVVRIEGRVRAASAGWAHTCAILDDGSVRCWGLRAFEVDQRAPLEFVGAQLRSQPTPVEIAIPRDATMMTTLGTSTCAKTGASRWCWRGADGANLLRVSDATFARARAAAVEPLPVFPDDEDTIASCSGADYRCLLLRGGEVQCTSPSCTRPIHGMPECALVPEKVPNLPGAMVGMTCGGGHACAWNASGELYCWGNNTFAQRASERDRDVEAAQRVDVTFERGGRSRDVYAVSSLLGNIQRNSARVSRMEGAPPPLE